MVVGVGTITFRLHDCHSLKGKRRVIKTIINKIRNNFNASVAEVDFNDIHQKAKIGIALAGSDRQLINSKLDKIINLADAIGLAEIIDTNIELISL
jgi:hypothetical protein